MCLTILHWPTDVFIVDPKAILAHSFLWAVVPTTPDMVSLTGITWQFFFYISVKHFDNSFAFNVPEINLE